MDMMLFNFVIDCLLVMRSSHIFILFTDKTKLVSTALHIYPRLAKKKNREEENLILDSALVSC